VGQRKEPAALTAAENERKDRMHAEG
jgi:hypothetical protein